MRRRKQNFIFIFPTKYSISTCRHRVDRLLLQFPVQYKDTVRKRITQKRVSCSLSPPLFTLSQPSASISGKQYQADRLKSWLYCLGVHNRLGGLRIFVSAVACSHLSITFGKVCNRHCGDTAELAPRQSFFFGWGFACNSGSVGNLWLKSCKAGGGSIPHHSYRTHLSADLR